jgi:hypothetical protein
MKRLVYGLLFLLCVGIGFAGGFYTAVALQKQIEVLVGAAIVLAVLTWIGSGADLLGLLREWYKDQREQETIPSLIFNGFYEKKTETFPFSENYFVKVSRKGGEGKAEHVTGHVGIKDKLELKEARWSSSNMNFNLDITTHKYLSLFALSKYKEKTIITFHGVFYNPNEPDYERLMENSAYENYKDSELIVEIYASRGRIKKNHLEKKIADIVQEAKHMPP